MPAIASNRKASAIDPSGSLRKGFALCAVCWLTVWMVMVTGVDHCPPEEWPARRSRSRRPRQATCAKGQRVGLSCPGAKPTSCCRRQLRSAARSHARAGAVVSVKPRRRHRHCRHGEADRGRRRCVVPAGYLAGAQHHYPPQYPVWLLRPDRFSSSFNAPIAARRWSIPHPQQTPPQGVFLFAINLK
jgi:hypothetical protein